MSLTLVELCDLHAGKIKCKVCGATASTTSRKCRTCAVITKFIDESIDDVLEDLGSLLTIGTPMKSFIESAMRPKAKSQASKRLLYALKRVSEAIEKRKK